MGADIRVHAARAAQAGAEPVADIEVRASALRGIAVPEALVPLAIDEFPVFFIAAACAQRRDRGARRAGAARQGERPAGGDGRGARGARRRACELLPDGLWHARGGGFGGGTHRQPRRSPHRDGLCGRQPAGHARRSRSWTWPTSPPPSRASRHRARGRLADPSCLTEACARMSDAAHGPRWSPSTVRAARARARSAARWRSASAGTCSTAARCTAWWPWPGRAGAWPPRTAAGMPRWPARMQVHFGSRPDGRGAGAAGRART